MLSAGQLGATNLLAQLLASISEHNDPDGEGIGAGYFESLAGGVATTIHLPSGDRYRVSVQWLGDGENHGRQA